MKKTIAAISTPPGTGAISVIRLSGPDSLEIVRRVFVPRGKAGPLKARFMRLGEIYHPGGGLIDEALAVYFPAPHSFTGEDCAEIQGHGGAAAAAETLAALLAAGAVLAEPGEFIRRAFENGRLDLAQAEAVADIIAAKSAAELALAARQLAGGLSDQVEGVHRAIFSALADLEASIDFSEDLEPINMADLAAKLSNEALEPLEKLLAQAGEGRLFRDGLRLTLAGAPNVGKSSLFNALLGEGRAMVNEAAGTTRDFISMETQWGGLKIELCDTAGLSENPRDDLDAQGQSLARGRLENSDIVLWVRDSARGGAENEIAPPDLPPGRAITLWNKCDLAEAAPIKGGRHPALAVSAKTGQGLEELKAAVLKLAIGGENPKIPEIVPSLRHQAALLETRDYLRAALRAMADGQVPDICALELKAALDSLGLICGRVYSEDILSEIFGRFCLGK